MKQEPYDDADGVTEMTSPSRRWKKKDGKQQ